MKAFNEEPVRSSDRNGVSLRDYVESFYTRKKMFLICLVVTPCVALLISFLIPKVYLASTKIWAKEQRTGDPFRLEESRLSFLKDQQELILSNEVAARVLESVLAEDSGEGSKNSWNKLSPESQAEKIAQLRKNVEADIDPGTIEGGSSFIILKAKAGSASQAARLANLFASKYIDYYYELKSKSAHDSYKFLEAQRDQVSGSLETSERRLQEFEEKLGPKLIPLLELIRQVPSSSFSEAYKFIGSYDTFSADWAEKTKGLKLLEKLREETGGTFVPTDSSFKNPSLGQLLNTVVNLKLKLSQLKQRWSDQSEDVDKLQGEVAASEDLLKGQLLEDFQTRNLEKEAAKEKLEFMEKRVREIEKDLNDIAENRSIYEKLRREVDNHAAIYKKVVEELESARIAAQMSIHKTASIYVIDKAVPPVRPVRPNKLLNLVLGILGGIVIGLGLIMISAYLDQTIRRPDQVSRYLGLDVLGSVSSFLRKK